MTEHDRRDVAVRPPTEQPLLTDALLSSGAGRGVAGVPRLDVRSVSGPRRSRPQTANIQAATERVRLRKLKGPR